MKLVILGGSAPSTPALFHYFRAQPAVPPIHAVLVGQSPERTRKVERAATLLSAGTPISLSSAGFGDHDLHNALDSADIVMIQIRCGGLTARAFDESFSLQYGLCGDEGLGAGGLAAGWRTWPRIQQLLDSIERSCPAALVILLTSPLSILVRLASECYPHIRLVGTCELPWVTLAEICTALNVSPDGVDFDYAAINHLGWFYRLSLGGRNLIQEFAARRSDNEHFPSNELVRSYGAIPTRYLRMHFCPSDVLREQRGRSIPRAQELQGIGERAFAAYENGGVEEVLRALSQRSTRWYPDAVGPLILAYSGTPQRIPFFLSARNGGCHPEFCEDDILEMPHKIQNGRVVALKSQLPPPIPIQEILAAFVRYERLASRAILQRNVDLLHQALACHPWTNDVTVIPELVEHVINSQPTLTAAHARGQ